jgi:shikimate kinase
MKLIFLYGPAASGKLTVGRTLHTLTGLRLFHNHLVVDTLLAVFPFGSPSFIRLREQIWLSVFEAAATDDTSLIFTFAPESTVNPEFIDNAIVTIRKSGGEVHFVRLDCPISVLEARMEDASRAQFLKLNSVATFRKLRAANADTYRELPADLTIDTSTIQPGESAKAICQHFNIPILEASPVIENYPANSKL